VVNVVITGGAGFLGSRLARELLAAGSLDVAGGGARPLSLLTLVDRAPVPPDLAADGRVAVVQGDLAELCEPVAAGRDVLTGADLIFHLAAAVSGECEADFDLGLRANLRATECLLASCRALGTSPVVVFASSVAVFGGSAEHPLPPVIDDQTLPNPQTSYGTQKFMCEQLLADYSRKGFLDGRALRLMTVCVRPGRPNAAASGFLSGIIREPLAGQRAVCPVDPRTEAALASPAKAIAGLLCAATSSSQAWGGRSAVNLPALTVSVADMAEALQRIAGPGVSSLIDWIPDPVVARMVATGPARIRADRAARLGLIPDPDIDSVIAMHLAESRLSAGDPRGYQPAQPQDLGVPGLEHRLDDVHGRVNGGLQIPGDAVPEETARQRVPEPLRGDGQQIHRVLARPGFRGHQAAADRAARRDARACAPARTPGRAVGPAPGQRGHVGLVAVGHAEQRGHHQLLRRSRCGSRRLWYGRLREHWRGLPFQDCLHSANAPPLVPSSHRCPGHTACHQCSAASSPPISRTSGKGMGTGNSRCGFFPFDLHGGIQGGEIRVRRRALLGYRPGRGRGGRVLRRTRRGDV
jgi:D-erythronate 2-dehydrogenase